MVSHLFFYQLVLVALVWLCVMLQWAWPSDPATVGPTTPEPPGPRPKRHRAPTPFAGLTTKPHCDACEHSGAPRPQTASSPPPRMVSTRGRRRQVDTSTHFCPNPDCAYRGWVGWGNLRANGHPSGGPWRQLLCIVCRGYFLETLGTIFHALAMEDRPEGLQKVAATDDAQQLSPGATTGMAIGPEIAPADPAPICTVWIGAEMRGG